MLCRTEGETSHFLNQAGEPADGLLGVVDGLPWGKDGLLGRTERPGGLCVGGLAHCRTFPLD